ncbi:hypothetical protein HJC23_000580 [Cyclotella cryptica]|uniref:Uncharacterized protein n=1 Tax=Cyclotella cryptica TaxID=29204 RepID=A0ABD3NGJ0_9STRA
MAPIGICPIAMAFIGFGVVIFTGDNGVSKAAQEIANTLFRLVSGNGGALLRDASLSSHNLMPQQPIVIHNVSPSMSSDISRNSGRPGLGMLIQLSMGAGACWASYVLLSQLLPESIKELLPVTRQFFDQAVTSLGQGIIRVRDVLSEQIAVLVLKQDELSAKQDSTHDAVNDLKKDIGDVRINIDDIAIAISRLLVQCVGDLLRNSNPTVADELDQFSRLSEEMDCDFHYRDNISGSSNGTTLKRSKLEYPSSPKISEIGSVSEIAMDDVRHISLPGSSHSLTPPPNSSGGVISPSPFGKSPSPFVGKSTLMSMRSMSMARQGSCPENEVPASEKDSFVPLDEVDQLLASIRTGAI